MTWKLSSSSVLEGEKTTQISRYWTGHCCRPLSLSWFSGEHLLVIAGLLRGRYPNAGFPKSTYVGSSDSPSPPLLNSSLPLQFLFPKVLPTDFSDSYFSVLELWKLISFLCQMVEDNQQTSQFWIPQNFPIMWLWSGVRMFHDSLTLFLLFLELSAYLDLGGVGWEYWLY